MILEISLIFDKDKITNVIFFGSDFLDVVEEKMIMINPKMI